MLTRGECSNTEARPGTTRRCSTTSPKALDPDESKILIHEVVISLPGIVVVRDSKGLGGWVSIQAGLAQSSCRLDPERRHMPARASEARVNTLLARECVQLQET